MKRFFYIILARTLVFSSGEKQPVNQDPGNGNNTTPSGPTTPQEPEKNWTYYYVNNFAYDLMDTYYLWKKEIKAQMMAWTDQEEPISKVASIRYKDDSGNDIDKWTQVTDDHHLWLRFL